MKLSAGFSKPAPSVLMFVCYGVSLAALTAAVKRIEISVAYAVWSGVGAVLIAGIGVLFFKEEIGMLKVLSILLVVAGVVGLNLSGRLH